jgi:hypothetical protein
VGIVDSNGSFSPTVLFISSHENEQAYSRMLDCVCRVINQRSGLNIDWRYGMLDASTAERNAVLQKWPRSVKYV